MNYFKYILHIHLCFYQIFYIHHIFFKFHKISFYQPTLKFLSNFLNHLCSHLVLKVLKLAMNHEIFNRLSRKIKSHFHF